MTKKQSWEEEFDKKFENSYCYLMKAIPTGEANPSTRYTSCGNEVRDFIKQAIQTREREVREELQKLETISAEVDNDNLYLQYQMGRSDREKEIKSELDKLVQAELEFINAPSASDDEVDIGSARLDAFGQVQEIFNNK